MTVPDADGLLEAHERIHKKPDGDSPTAFKKLPPSDSERLTALLKDAPDTIVIDPENEVHGH